MIRKLRAKLIIASLLSLLLVLSVIIGVAGVLNYTSLVSDADSVLAILRENDGTFPLGDPPGGKDRFREGRRFSPELPYESRYFTVFLSESGSVISVNTGKIAAVDTSTAIDYAVEAVASGAARGFADDYRFTVYASGEETHVVFLDCGRELGSFRSFLATSAAVSAAGLLAVTLLLIFFSGRIVKPFSENYEKQRRFITDAGHELKTPMTIIGADADLLEMECGENQWLTDIRSQARRLTDLTNDLIYLSRMDEEQPRLQCIEFPLSDVAEEMALSFQGLARSQGKDLDLHIQPLLSCTGDEKAIRQLLSILLDNALKYSPAGGRLELRLEKQGRGVVLAVSNTAAEPVDREKLPHLFDRFYRSDQSRSSQTGGYGLGLSIARSIVLAHKGRIRAESPDGRSLSVIVTLPA